MSTNTPSEKGTPQSGTYTVNDIAAILGIGRATAYKLANSGAFKTIRIGNMIRISRKSFEDWLKAEGLDDLMEDHLALELAFMDHLIGENDTKHQQAFLESHLLNWVPDFVADIDRYARQDFYKAVGLITLGFLKLDLSLLSGLNDPENHALQKAPSFSVRADRMENIFARMKERYLLLAPTGGIPPRYGEINVLTDIALKEPASLQPLELRPLLASSDRDVLLFLPPAHLAEARAWADELEHRVRFLLLEPAGGSRCSWEKAKDCSAAVHIDDICALVEVRDEALLPYFQDEVPIN